MATVKSAVAWAVFIAAAAMSTTVYGQVIDTIIPNNYHGQVYNNWCGSASIEMMLDCPAVTGANAIVAQLLFVARRLRRGGRRSAAGVHDRRRHRHQQPAGLHLRVEPR